MLKIDYGDVESPDGSKYEKILLKPGLTPSGKVGSIVGGILTIVGIGFLTYGAYKNGGDSYYREEAKALSKAGSLDMTEKEANNLTGWIKWK